MKLFKSQKQFRRVESTSFFVETLLLLEMMEQLSAVYKPIAQSSKKTPTIGEAQNRYSRKNKVQLLF